MTCYGDRSGTRTLAWQLEAISVRADFSPYGQLSVEANVRTGKCPFPHRQLPRSFKAKNASESFVAGAPAHTTLPAPLVGW